MGRIFYFYDKVSSLKINNQGNHQIDLSYDFVNYKTNQCWLNTFLSVTSFFFFLHALGFFVRFNIEPGVNTIRSLTTLWDHLGDQDGSARREGLTYYVRLSG